MTENSKAPKDEDQAAQSTQQQTRPPNPHNNKPGRPNLPFPASHKPKIKQKSQIIRIQTKISNNSKPSKNARLGGPPSPLRCK